jgi:hypothetical protein
VSGRHALPDGHGRRAFARAPRVPHRLLLHAGRGLSDAVPGRNARRRPRRTRLRGQLHAVPGRPVLQRRAERSEWSLLPRGACCTAERACACARARLWRERRERGRKPAPRGRKCSHLCFVRCCAWPRLAAPTPHPKPHFPSHFPQYFCPAGSSVAAPPSSPCPRGTYSATGGGADLGACALCLSGRVCANNGTSIPAPCPPGSYCPPGTSSATGTLCPASTFNNATGARTVRECAACLPGSFCASPGLTAPTGLCAPGYYCVSPRRAMRRRRKGGTRRRKSGRAAEPRVCTHAPISAVVRNEPL